MKNNLANAAANGKIFRLLGLAILASWAGPQNAAAGSAIDLLSGTVRDKASDIKAYVSRRVADAQDANGILRGESTIRSSHGLSIGMALNSADEWRWVEVLKPVRNAENNFSAGNVCGIERGALVTVLGFSSDRQNALVRYGANATQYGAHCPSGTLFFLPIRELAAGNAIFKEPPEEQPIDIEAEYWERRLAADDYERQQDIFPSEATLQAKISEAADLLKSKPALKSVHGFTLGETLNLNEFRWVHVMESISNGNGSFPAGEVCGIGGRQGRVTILGFSSDMKHTLVRYALPETQYGSLCPGGALFFLPTRALFNMR